GHEHHVEPRNIVGAIANEAGVDSEYIGRIDIRADHSFVDLPKGMPKEVFTHLKKVWVANQQLAIQRVSAKDSGYTTPRKPKSKTKPKSKSKKKRELADKNTAKTKKKREK